MVIAMRDVSGCMGEFEKYISRSFYFWMVRFLRTKYETVQIVFITHHTDAKEVDEEAFFNLGESGGTKVSSAYQLALDIVNERYEPSSVEHLPLPFLRRRQLGRDGQPALPGAGRPGLLEKSATLWLRRDPGGRSSVSQHADVGASMPIAGPALHPGDDRVQGRGLSRAAAVLLAPRASGRRVA